MSAVPDPYQRQFNFTTYQVNNPGQPLPGVQVDAELNHVKTSMDETQARLAGLQRDDGQLKNQIVTLESLGVSVLSLFAAIGGNVRGPWATATAYAQKDIVTFNGGTYVAAVAHTSTVFATNYAAGDWVALFSPTRHVPEASDIPALVPDFIGQILVQEDNGDLWVSDGITAGDWERINDGVQYHNASYVTVQTASTAVANGTALLAAYAFAKALTPNGNSLSATNRAVVVVPPGDYDLGSSELVLDTQFVDIIGLTTDRRAQYIHTITGTANAGTIRQTANDVTIQNLYLHNGASSDGTGSSASSAAYFPATNLGSARLRNVELHTLGGGDISPFPARVGVIYAGTYEDCVSTLALFGGTSGTTTATVASGTFTRCQGGLFAFGGGNGCSVTGTLYDCVGRDDSFGGNGGSIASTALLMNCRKTGSLLTDFSTIDAAARIINFVDPSFVYFLPTAPTNAGGILKSVYAEDATFALKSTTIPADNTIPQISEGDEIITATITPSSTTSKIRVRFSGFVNTANNTTLTMALFQDAITGALFARGTAGLNAKVTQVGFEVVVSPGSTSAITYRVRTGAATGYTYYNGNNFSPMSRLYGGVAKTTLVLEEIKG